MVAISHASFFLFRLLPQGTPIAGNLRNPCYKCFSHVLVTCYKCFSHVQVTCYKCFSHVQVTCYKCFSRVLVTCFKCFSHVQVTCYKRFSHVQVTCYKCLCCVHFQLFVFILVSATDNCRPIKYRILSPKYYPTCMSGTINASLTCKPHHSNASSWTRVDVSLQRVVHVFHPGYNWFDAHITSHDGSEALITVGGDVVLAVSLPFF